MAYNLESLITILQQILNPDQTRWILDDHNKQQLQSLFQKADSLKQILENSYSLPEIESFESQIRNAAHQAEDIVESHMLEQMVSRPRDVSFPFLPPNLHQVTQQLGSVTEQVVKLVEGKTVASSGSSSSGSRPSSSPDPSSKSLVVGVDEALMQLTERLIGVSDKLEIVPIVGMGGIGKTTLARQLYQDPLIVEHFKYRAWTTISQDYDMQSRVSQDHSMRAALLELLGCIVGKGVDEHVSKKNAELKTLLHQSLYVKRYMIVLDDIWGTKFWDHIRSFFPDTKNGSRIVLTTRESDVAKHFNSESKQHEMQLLDKPESWNLLRQEVFGDESCHDDALERIGRNIASNCGGLPLAIHVIGGLLSKLERSQGIWESVAKDVRAVVISTDEKLEFSNILSLSYNHLPSHIRPCFLYMGAFPEDHEIKASKLIKLLVGEGFLRGPKGDKSMEDEAEECLMALVGRNLVSVKEVKSTGRAKSYRIHDLLRELCLKKAAEQKFVHVESRVEQGFVSSRNSIRRVSVHPSYRFNGIQSSKEFMFQARSFVCTGLVSHAILSPIYFALSLLRVLDILDILFHRFPTEVLHILNLRYLAFSYNCWRLPSDISRLWNLQTLIIRSSAVDAIVEFPREMWLMEELRHVKVYNATFNYGYEDDDHWKCPIQEKLQTIDNLCYPLDRFLAKITNIKKFGIHIYSDIDLCHLQKLQTLKCTGSSGVSRRIVLSRSKLRLPNCVRKLCIKNFKIVEEFMKHVCELQDLEVLKLEDCEFGGEEEWDAEQLVFNSLRFLLLKGLPIVQWQANDTNFPRLRHLVIRGCSELEEIPPAIGDITTLQTIELDGCSSSLVDSAQLIIDDQRDLENYHLQLRTT